MSKDGYEDTEFWMVMAQKRREDKGNDKIEKESKNKKLAKEEEMGGNSVMFQRKEDDETGPVGLQLTVKTANWGCDNNPCEELDLSPHAQGVDPYHTIVVCVSSTLTDPVEAVHTPSPKSKTLETEPSRILIKLKEKLSVDDKFLAITGVTQLGNNWLLLMETAAKAANYSCVSCMGPRPLLRVIPTSIPPACLVEVMTKSSPNAACASWNDVYPVTKATKDKPIFSVDVAMANFSCINLTGTKNKMESLAPTWCKTTVLQTGPLLPRSDVWWWCGGTRLFDSLKDATGVCALVSLLLPVFIFPSTLGDIQRAVTAHDPLHHLSRKRRASWWDGGPTYLDAIGVPRGVPDEYKLVNQIAAGWESIFIWVTPNKNVDRINYIHYNVQKLGNYTEEGFIAVREQLAATSLMAFQNRIAVDMLLAERGGVCAMFGDQCCTFIPNNTSPDGSLTRAIEGLRTLNRKMKEHSGVSTSAWDEWWEKTFGKYKSLVFSVMISMTLFTSILVLCGCCCIPCIRALLVRLISTAVAPTNSKLQEMYPLLISANHGDGGDTNDQTSDEIITPAFLFYTP